MTKTRTKKAIGTYWERNGKYQEDYNRLFEKLVPQSGHAVTTRGQLLLSLSKVYHDYYNNGLCNSPGGFIFGHAMNILGVHRHDIAPMIDDDPENRGSVMRRVSSEIFRHWKYTTGDDCEDSYANFSKEWERDFEKVADAVILYVKAEDERIKAAK